MVAIFTRSITDDLTSLVKQIDKLVGENEEKQMRAFVVLLSDDPDADEAKLQKLAEKHKIKNVPLTIFDGLVGPPKYKIAEGAEVTVLMWTKQTVKVNHAYAKGKLNAAGVKTVVKSTAKILD